MGTQYVKVAIVDDDHSVRRALARLLKAEAMDAVEYSSGTEFLEDMKSVEPQCIILDLHMPGMNGLDVLRHLAGIQCGYPVIVITGHDSPTTRADAMALGAVRYLAKPVDYEVLVDAIQRVAAGDRGRACP